jgi:DNA-binding NtrC family response regulator
MATAKVLIVDDEPPLLSVYTRILIRHGYNAIPANGPAQALEIMQAHFPVAVVLSDVMMPGMCGTDLVREIRLRFPDTACVLMTGGAVGSVSPPPDVPLLRKPLSTCDLIRAVEQAVAKSANLRAKLDDELERSVQLRLASKKLLDECRALIKESEERIRNARSIMEKCRSRPKG